SGNTQLQAGNLIFNGQPLTLNGTFSSIAGSLSSDNSSTLTIGGSDAFGTFLFANTGNTLHTLNCNRASGTATLDGTLVISNNLNLINGSLTNNAGLTMRD